MVEKRPLGTIEKMESLAKIDIFSQLGSHELLLLADQATEINFEQDALIFNEGEIGRDAFTLIDGQVILERAEKSIGTVNSGESFGAMELLSNQPRLFSAHAARPSLCLKIDRETFWEILEDYPAVSRAILEVLVQQIRDLTDRIASTVSV
jgi:CRP-like cAMP-binding protein